MLKKRLMSLGIAVILILSSLNTTVIAAGFCEQAPGAKASMNLINPGKDKNNNGVNYKFYDLKDVAWAFNAIEKLALKGILNGVGQGMFAPQNKVTHLEALAMVLRLTGDENEAENRKNQKHSQYKGPTPTWGLGYIFVAIEKGILLPEELGDFNFNTPAKRHEIAKYIIRALGKTDEALKYMDKELSFKDSSSVPKKSVGYVYLVNKLGIMIGDNNNKFNPMEPVTRAEMAVLLDRAEGDFELPDTDYRKNNIVFVQADTNKNKITVNIKGSTVTYDVLSGAQIYRNGSFGTIDDLVKGDILQIILNDNKKVIFIEVLKGTENDDDDEETEISFSKVSYNNLPTALQDEVDRLKSAKNYKAYEYDSYIYLMAFMGRQKTGGYSVSIEDVTKTEKNGNYTIRAEVYSDTPSSGSYVTQSITYPYTVVRFKSFSKIKSVIFTDTDGDKIKEVNIEKPVEVSTVKGVIYDLISSSKTIKVEKSDGSKMSYTIPSSAKITVNGYENSSFSDLWKGMNVELEIKNDVVTKVIADGKTEDSISFKAVEYNNLATHLKDQVDSLKLSRNYKAFEYENSIYLIATLGKKTASGYEIAFEALDKISDGSKFIVRAEVSVVTPFPSEGTKTVYPYSIVKFSKFSNISKVRFVDEDGSKLADSNIVKLADTYEVTGKINKINTAKKNIEVEKSDGTVITLSVPEDAQITVNKDDKAFKDLKTGMTVKIEIVDDIVAKIDAEDKNLELTGELSGITITEEKKITVKIDGKNKTYTVDSSVVIIIDGEDNKSVEDLTVGDRLTLSFINGTLIQIAK
ncbi:MAG TPA: S-layer homology domain-containing protein [Bacillota bacterium]|nr:S-layer homology domain-containing protein [Bacillota bacterium]HPL53118.1 S-layer homology domain-containing protein [Bacillota bacterium]